MDGPADWFVEAIGRARSSGDVYLEWLADHAEWLRGRMERKWERIDEKIDQFEREMRSIVGDDYYDNVLIPDMERRFNNGEYNMRLVKTILARYTEARLGEESQSTSTSGSKDNSPANQTESGAAASSTSGPGGSG